MKFGRRREQLISVVVPVYDVAAYLPACLDSLLAQTHRALEVVVVDDGSTDDSGEVAESYAAREDRVRVVHTANHGLGAARNEGLRHVTGDVLAFADSDDVVPPAAYETLLRQLNVGADLVTGSIVWWEDAGTPDEGLREPPWMRRLHRDRRMAVVEQTPEILGDVFAWNKLYRRDFWEANALAWPEGVRYEDQPTTTRAYLAARRFGIVPDVVYHWRIRHDGTSITQQRASVEDLRDRWATKRSTWAAVSAYGAKPVSEVVHDRVLPGDLHRYFVLIPGCSDEWWDLLRAGVLEFWSSRSLARSGLPPAHRLTGWLVEQGRRAEASTVMTALAALGPGEMLPRGSDAEGRRWLEVPGIEDATIPLPVRALRPHER